MRRSVQMRSIMFEHPEAPREITVLFDGGIHLGFEKLCVSGPGHQLVADRVTQVDHPGLPGRHAFEHRPMTFVLEEECGKDCKTNDNNTRAANGSHLSPQFTLSS